MRARTRGGRTGLRAAAGTLGALSLALATIGTANAADNPQADSTQDIPVIPTDLAQAPDLTSATEPQMLSQSAPAVADPSVATASAISDISGFADPAGMQQTLTRQELLRQKVAQIRQRIVALAKAQVGDTYSAGGAGPERFDCSGLALYVYKEAADHNLPHYSRSQYKVAKKIPKALAKPGDLVFYLSRGAHHVGVYIGNNRMVHAIGRGKGVRLT
ncbi:MAG: C40 family peptidase, partial [Actinomycetales bacterium]